VEGRGYKYYQAVWNYILHELVRIYVGVSDVRQAEIHTVEPLVPEPSALKVVLAIEKKKIQVTWYRSDTSRTD
jgi:hypothetical protein